jgi:uncharacterized membrane protein YukC
MFIICAITFGVILIIRCFFDCKTQSEAFKSGNYILKKDYDELIEGLKRLTPEQMNKLNEDFDEWLKQRKSKNYT